MASPAGRSTVLSELHHNQLKRVSVCLSPLSVIRENQLVLCGYAHSVATTDLFLCVNQIRSVFMYDRFQI